MPLHRYIAQVAQPTWWPCGSVGVKAPIDLQGKRQSGWFGGIHLLRNVLTGQVSDGWRGASPIPPSASSQPGPEQPQPESDDRGARTPRPGLP